MATRVSTFPKARTGPVGRAELLALTRALLGSPDIPLVIERLRDALRPLFADVDRVALNVNRTASFDPENRVTRQTSGLHVFDLDHSQMSFRADAKGAIGGERLLRAFQAAGFPVGDYRPPTSFDYYRSNGAYLGTLMLLNRKESLPVSQETLSFVEQTKTLLEYIFTSFAARYQSAHTEYRSINLNVGAMCQACQLTDRQREILVCRMEAPDIRSISRILGISPSTVRRHLREIRSRVRIACENRSPPNGLDVDWEPLRVTGNKLVAQSASR